MVSYLLISFTSLLWLQGAESERFMNYLIIVSITGLGGAVNFETNNTPPRLTHLSLRLAVKRSERPCLSLQLESGKSGGMFSRH